MPLKAQQHVHDFYYSLQIQIGVAILISANFLTNIVEKEIDPQGEKYETIFTVFEMFFNACFTIELAINLYANWFCQFWESSWNVFDFIVVSIGILNTLPIPMPPALNMLRMMRAFRVFRLFKRVHSLNKIIVAIMRSLPGVRDAFLILFIVMSIFAILAVEFWYNLGAECHDESHTDHRFLTPRGYCIGEEYYGTFTKSLYTLFQVLTGESWSEAVARPTIWYYFDKPFHAVGCGMFFILYVLITAFVLTNVVVAVLLDKMVDPEVAAAAAERHPDNEIEDEAEGDTANGEGDLKDPTSEELQNMMESVTKSVEQLMAVSERQNLELRTFRSEMTSLRDQIKTCY